MIKHGRVSTPDRIRSAKEKGQAQGYRWLVIDIYRDEIEYCRTKKQADRTARDRRVIADLFLEIATNVGVEPCRFESKGDKIRRERAVSR